MHIGTNDGVVGLNLPLPDLLEVVVKTDRRLANSAVSWYL